MELLERELAMAAVEAALAEAEEGAGRVVFVAGEAGIGKTALVTRIARARELDRRFLWGVCDPLLTPRALGPIHDIVREAGARLAGGARGRVRRAARQLAGQPPTVMVVEDLHWADDASLDVIAVVGRRIGRTTGTLVLTYRSDEIELRPEVGAVLRRAARGRRPEDRARAALARRGRAAGAAAGRSSARLHATTGGNPFFVNEVLASAEPGVPGRRSATWSRCGCRGCRTGRARSWRSPRSSRREPSCGSCGAGPIRRRSRSASPPGC